MYGRIILKWILNDWGKKVWTGFLWLAEFCQHGREPWRLTAWATVSRERLSSMETNDCDFSVDFTILPRQRSVYLTTMFLLHKLLLCLASVCGHLIPLILRSYLTSWTVKLPSCWRHCGPWFAMRSNFVEGDGMWFVVHCSKWLLITRVRNILYSGLWHRVAW
jgi:hypothetical protein